MTNYGAIDERIVALEKRRKPWYRVQDPEWSDFRVACSCPPSKIVHVRGGLTWASKSNFGEAFTGLGWVVPNLQADLGDPTSVTVDITFTAANWYKAYGLVLLIPVGQLEDPQPSDWRFALTGLGTEVETDIEAEVDLVNQLRTNSYPDQIWPDQWGNYGAGMLLCGVICRNDGFVGAGGHILPIEFVNRGNSYLWPSDLRSVWQAYR